MATEFKKMKQRRDTAANWTSANPILAAGEIGFEIDTRKFKIGDGTTAWNSLTDYFITASPVVCEIGVAVSDEITDLSTGLAKITFRMPYAMTLTAVRASVNGAPTGAAIIVDINESNTSVLSTKLSIDATEKTSLTAASAAVISDSALADDAEITIDIDQVGSIEPGTGLKVWLKGTRV